MTDYLDLAKLITTMWPIGFLPGKLQERIAKRCGRDPNAYFYAQLFVSTCVSIGVYTAGQIIENPDTELLKYIDELATIYVLGGRVVPTSVRYGLSRLIKRPVGSYAIEATNILLERIYSLESVRNNVERITDITDRLRERA